MPSGASHVASDADSTVGLSTAGMQLQKPWVSPNGCESMSTPPQDTMRQSRTELSVISASHAGPIRRLFAMVVWLIAEEGPCLPAAPMLHEMA